MAKVVTATDLRAKVREVIQNAQFQGDHVIVTVFDKPAVAIIGIDDYRDYVAYREQQRDQARERWERLRAIVENNTTLDELTDEELQAIVEDVRTTSRANREQTLAGADSQHRTEFPDERKPAECRPLATRLPMEESVSQEAG